MAREMALSIGQEVTLGRLNLGLTLRGAAHRAGVAYETQRRVEASDPGASLLTVCRVAAPLGVKVWGKGFPAATPSLRDTGQLGIAELIRRQLPATTRCELEHGLGNGRAIDMVVSGADEILAIEIERLLADLQAQYRIADAKRLELAADHQRPVRLVMAVADTRRNRAAVAEHARLVRVMLPATSREILAALRRGEALGRDGVLWVRPSRARTAADRHR